MKKLRFMEDPQLVPHLMYERDTDLDDKFFQKNLINNCTVYSPNPIYITLQ
jgi:hypothetical protein